MTRIIVCVECGKAKETEALSVFGLLLAAAHPPMGGVQGVCARGMGNLARSRESREMKLTDGTRVDSPWARNSPRQPALRLDHMGRPGVGLCIECREKLGEE